MSEQDKLNLGEVKNADGNAPPPQKSKGPIIGLVVVLLAVALGIGAYATGMFGGGNKNEKVAEALGSLYKGENNPFIANWVGQEELNKNMAKGYGLSANLELVEMPILESEMGMTLPKGIMLSMETASDNTAGTASGKMGVGMMGSTLLRVDFFTSQSKFQVAVPALFKEVIAADISGDLQAKLANSPLFKDSLDAASTEMIRMFPAMLKDSQELSQRITKMMTGELKLAEYPGLKAAMDKFRDSWTVADADAKTMTWNGKQENFKGYLVTVEKADVVVFLKEVRTYITTDQKFKDDFLDYFARQLAISEQITEEAAYVKIGEEMDKWIAEIEADATLTKLQFTVHMTKANELVSFQANSTKDGETADLLLERNGGDFPNQNMKAALTVTGGENPGKLELLSSGQTTGSEQSRKLTMKIEGMESDALALVMDTKQNKESGAVWGSISADGKAEGQPLNFIIDLTGMVKDVVKDKSASYVLDNMKITSDGQVLAQFKGEMKYSTENVTVKTLEGTELDIFTATEEDMNNIMTQIQQNAGVLLQLIGMPSGS